MNGPQLVTAMLIVVSLLYAGAAFGYWLAGRNGTALVFIGYVAANLGLIADALTQGVK